MAEQMNIVVKKVGLPPIEQTVDHTLEKMQELVGGYIECVRLPREIDMWINEESLLVDEPKLNVQTIAYGKVVHQICGDIFFAGHDGKGNTISLTEFQKYWLSNNMKTIGLMINDETEESWKVDGIFVR